MAVNRANIGKTVRLDAIPAWLRQRVGFGYCLLKPGMIGKIICTTAAQDKYAVEFEEPIFKNKPDGYQSTFDNGCYNKGKVHHCCYLLPGHIAIAHVPGQYDNLKNEQLQKRKRLLL